MFGIEEVLNELISPIETKAMFNGHEIVVRLSPKEIKLFINGEGMESIKPALRPKKDVPILRGKNKGDDKFLVEVFGQSGFFRPKIKICVNGQKIGGDDF